MPGPLVGGAMVAGEIDPIYDQMTDWHLDETNATSYTWTAKIGKPHAKRVVVVVGLMSGIDITGCTIDAVAMTADTTLGRMTIFHLAQATGTTASIVLSSGSASGHGSIQVYAIYPASATPDDKVTVQTSAALLTASDVACSTGGRLIFGANGNNNQTISASWNGLDALTTLERQSGNAWNALFGHNFRLTETVTTNDLAVTFGLTTSNRVAVVTWGA